MTTWVDRVLAWPWVYRLWIAPFARQKLRPVLRHADLAAARRVLDIGCGPGTNAPLFVHADYLGIDINPAYVASARRRHAGRFIVADVTRHRFEDEELFDLILVNSLLHHLDDAATARLLDHLRTQLTADGRIHILELVQPDRLSIARWLARHDRGRFARPIARWTELLNEVLTPEIVEPYDVRLAGVPLWHMVYYVGRTR